MKGGFPLSLSLEEQYDKIHAYCYFKTHNAALAEDLTQEAFLRFFSQQSYINRGKPLAYLYTIAKNLCVDAYRRPEPVPLTDETADMTVNLDALDTSLAIKTAVSGLPEDLQEIFLLRFANDLTMAEISAVTGLSRFAVNRKIKNALQLLKQVLRKEDFS
jgi:RNA polymerase sigma-70 factor (ECF subfamily)